MGVEPHSDGGLLRCRGYDLAATTIVALSFALLLNARTHLPIFSDSWYHLGVIRAFFERGPSLHAWWEFAPFGRPHLYPPLFHVIGVALLRLTGWNLLDVARAYDVVTFPVVLAAGWWAARLLFGQRAAFLTLLLLALNIGLVFPCSLIMMPGTYALLLWPFAHVLLVRDKPVLAGMLLSGTCYLHQGVAGAVFVSVFLFAIYRREYFRRALAVSVIAAAIFSPWLVHLWQHRGFLHAGEVRLPIFMPMFTLVAAAVGVVAAVRSRDKESQSVLCMILGSGLFLFTLPERFWTYGGFLFALLGGYGLDRYAGARIGLVVGVLLASCLSITPFLRPLGMRLAVPVPLQTTPFLMGSPLLTFAQWQRTDVATKMPEALPDDLAGLAHWVRQNTGRDDIVLTKDRLAGAALFVLAGRRTTSGLWTEVMTSELKERLEGYYQTAGGYLVVNTATGAEPPGRAEFVISFGRFAVFHRPATP